MNNYFDEFGPEYIVGVYDPKIKMRGFLVIDNTAMGPGKGGIRMTANITAEEVFRLARTMTWKNALAELPFGGAKSGIIWKGGSDNLKKQYIQSFARAISVFTPKKYIAAPDINTGEKEMQWFVEATDDWKSATGKPADLCMKVVKKSFSSKSSSGAKKICGIPHEFGSTGFGVAKAAEAASGFLGFNIKNATIAVAGFGNVGSFAFKYLEDMGAKIVAVSDICGTLYDENGLSFKKLIQLKRKRKPITSYSGGKKSDINDIYELPVDILIPAAVPDIINDKNINNVKAKIIVEGANIPIRDVYEEALRKKGVLIVPDIIANAGGVISSFAEWRGYNPKRMFNTIERRIVKNTNLILTESKKQNRPARHIAKGIAQKRVIEAMKKKQDMAIRNKLL